MYLLILLVPGPNVLTLDDKYANFFSGEVIADNLDLSPSSSPKDTTWALQDRAILLWLSCVRMRNDPGTTDFEKAQFAVTTWLEADAIESILNNHTCGLERAFLFYAREYLFMSVIFPAPACAVFMVYSTRMCASQEFQRHSPLVSSPSVIIFCSAFSSS